MPYRKTGIKTDNILPGSHKQRYLEDVQTEEGKAYHSGYAVARDIILQYPDVESRQVLCQLDPTQAMVNAHQDSTIDDTTRLIFNVGFLDAWSDYLECDKQTSPTLPM